MENKEIRLANLRKLLKEAVSASALAHAAGTSPAYISQILSKKAKGCIGNKLARKLELATNKSKGWLDQIHSSEAPVEAAFLLGSIPMIAAEVLLTSNLHKEAQLYDGNMPKVANEDLSNPEGLFCITMAGDAMVSVTNIDNSICHADIIVINKHLKCGDGDIVLVKFAETIKVRQFTKDGNQQILKPFNLQYPVIPFNHTVEVLGVVVEIRRKIKTAHKTASNFQQDASEEPEFIQV